MKDRRVLAAPIAWMFSVALAACGPSPEAGAPDAGGPTDEECFDEGLHRCSGSNYQICQDGFWWHEEACTSPQFCTPTVGCAECNPQYDNTCVGDNVFACNEDGTIGEMVMSCGLEQCANGVCGGDECGAAGVKLIYVVDESYRLLSFDPGNGNVFTLIGQLDCPAGASWPGWGDLGPATPFSMSVDRNATAWVLYTSGQIFHVSTQDASCASSGFSPGQLGYELFGMGFVADAPGSTSEKLYIAGGAASDPSGGNVGYVDPSTLTVTSVGPIPAAEYSPELTGTGNAELFGYYPGVSSFVARMNTANGSNVQQWALLSLVNPVMAWAFAHWGGRFYVFVTTTDLFTGATLSQVYLLDPMTGAANLLLDDIPYIIVGAGVSTCAPVIIQ